jgi:hypothetical protein
MASRFLVLTALLILFCSSASRAEVNFNLFLGIRDETGSSDRLPAVGIAADVGPSSWFVRPEFGAQIGFDPIFPGYESEYSLGLVRYWDLTGRGRVHFGAGVARLGSSFGFNEGSSAGGYAHGGIVWSRGEDLSLGLDLRFLKASDIRIENDSFPLGYTQLTFLMSWRWWSARR